MRNLDPAHAEGLPTLDEMLDNVQTMFGMLAYAAKAENPADLPGLLAAARALQDVRKNLPRIYCLPAEALAGIVEVEPGDDPSEVMRQAHQDPSTPDDSYRPGTYL